MRSSSGVEVMSVRTCVTLPPAVPTHSHCVNSQLITLVYRILCQTARSVSAPGKVLIAGGYLVLERPLPGLVLASSSRFVSSIWWETDLVAQDPGTMPVVVESPQFLSTDTFRLSIAPAPALLPST